MAALATLAASNAWSAEPVKIGILVPLSGPTAQFGNNIRNGVELALEDMKETGGLKALGADVELVYADVPAPNAAAAATQRLISQDGVVGIIGSFVSSITLAASEVTERAGVPMMTHSFADQITSRGYKFIFQVANKASLFGEKQLTYALDIAKRAGSPVSKIAILYEDTAYGTAQAKGLRDTANRLGIQIVVDESYPLNLTDASPLVNKLRASGADLVFPVSYFNDAILIIRTMRQQNLDIPTVGGAAGYIIPDFKKGLGDLVEGVYSIAPANYDALPAIAEKYKKKYGAFMPHEALMYGAAFQHMVKAIEVAQSRDPEKIRDAIAALRKCDGFSAGLPGGCTAFDANGLTSVAFPVFVQWRGDDIVTVYPPEVAKAPAYWRGKEVK
ncbi:MAG: ABC transporter substrate-binding protein [Xanthobacteraceae bacterium]|nr:ABC transporter substrate-binding protein [Xanthobacteraceae bacterium]